MDSVRTIKRGPFNLYLVPNRVTWSLINKLFRKYSLSPEVNTQNAATTFKRARIFSDRMCRNNTTALWQPFSSPMELVLRPRQKGKTSRLRDIIRNRHSISRSVAHVIVPGRRSYLNWMAWKQDFPELRMQVYSASRYPDARRLTGSFVSAEHPILVYIDDADLIPQLSSGNTSVFNSERYHVIAMAMTI